MHDAGKPIAGAEHHAAIAGIVAAELGMAPGEAHPGARLNADLGADLLDVVGIVLAIEARFGIAIADEEADRCATVADWCALVAHRLAARPSEPGGPLHPASLQED